MTDLPPLPQPMLKVYERPHGLCELRYFTAEDMRAYAEAAIKHEREACAKECDEMPQRLGIHCARAIRARSEDREGSSIATAG